MAPRPRLRNTLMADCVPTGRALAPPADCVPTGRALALLAVLTLASNNGAQAQQKAAQPPAGAAQTSPAQPYQGFPWAHPVAPGFSPPGAPPASTQGQGAGPVPPAVLRPAASS